MTRDERPRPQFGELAPEGWSWKPPVDPDSGESTPGSADSGAKPPAAAKPSETAADSTPDSSADVPPRRPLRLTDVSATIAFLVIGIYTTIGTVPELFHLSRAIDTFYAQEGLGDFTARAEADQAGAVAGILHVIILLTAIWLSVRLIQRRRLAFWVPLAAGALAMIIVFVAMAVALLADPNIAGTIATMQGS